MKYILCAGIGALIAFFLQVSLIGIVFFAAGGFFVAWGFSFLSAEKVVTPNVEVSEEPVQATANLTTFSSEETKTEVYDIKDIMERLLAINTNIRITPNVSAKILTSTEALINNLRDALIDAHQAYPDDDLTWQLDEIIVEFLPELLLKYTNSSMSDELTTSTVSTIDTLNAQVSKISNAIQKNSTADLKSINLQLTEIVKLRETH